MVANSDSNFLKSERHRDPELSELSANTELSGIGVKGTSAKDSQMQSNSYSSSLDSARIVEPEFGWVGTKTDAAEVNFRDTAAEQNPANDFNKGSLNSWQDTGPDLQLRRKDAKEPLAAQKSAADVSDSLHFATDSLIGDEDYAELDFDTVQDADEFHSDLDLAEWSADFESVDETITALNDDDDDSSSDWATGNFAKKIEADDLHAPGNLVVAKDPEKTRFRSFLEVHHGRKSHHFAEAPWSERYAIDEALVRDWVSETVANGGACVEQIEELVSFCRGSFEFDALTDNIRRELETLDLFRDPNEHSDVQLTFELGSYDEDELVELLQSICCGSNLSPGVRRSFVSRREEKQTFLKIEASIEAMYRALVSSKYLSREVISVGQDVVDGRANPSVLTSLSFDAQRHCDVRNRFAAGLEKFSSATLAEESSLGQQTSSCVRSLKAMAVTPKFLRSLCDTSSKNADQIDGVEAVLAALEEFERAVHSSVEIYLSEMRRISTRLSDSKLESDDAFQEGFFGLKRAVEKFDFRSGNRFMTYAQYSVRQAVSRAKLDGSQTIRIPVHRHEDLRRLDGAVAAFEKRNSGKPTLDEVAKDMGEPIAKIKELLDVPRFASTFHASQVDAFDTAPDSEEVFFNFVERTAVVSDLLAELPERRRDILIKRFGFSGDEMTLEEVGQIYGVTRERIRQIEAKALDWARHPARLKQLRERL